MRASSNRAVLTRRCSPPASWDPRGSWERLRACLRKDRPLVFGAAPSLAGWPARLALQLDRSTARLRGPGRFVSGGRTTSDTRAPLLWEKAKGSDPSARVRTSLHGSSPTRAEPRSVPAGPEPFGVLWARALDSRSPKGGPTALRGSRLRGDRRRSPAEGSGRSFPKFCPPGTWRRGGPRGPRCQRPQIADACGFCQTLDRFVLKS